MSQAGTSPRVSVVLPTHNRAHLLPRAIRSVLSQTFGDLELLVIDDASTDGTVEVLKHFDDARIRVLPLGENRGVSAARNEGLRAARGEFVAFLDSDDEWLPSRLERQMDRFGDPDGPGASLVYCFYVDENVVGEGGSPYFDPTIREGDVFDHVLRGWMPQPSTMTIRRSSILEVGLFDEGLRHHEDYDFTLRLCAASHRFLVVPEPLVVYHDHPGPRMIRDRAPRLHDLDALLERWGPVVRERLGRSALRRWTARESVGLRFAGVGLAMGRGDRRTALRHCRALVGCLPHHGSPRVLASALLLAMLGPDAHEALRRSARAVFDATAPPRPYPVSAREPT